MKLKGATQLLSAFLQIALFITLKLRAPEAPD
jgi:hypothetical protein